MADSNITKRALARALKELLETHSFSQISVGSICEKCGMNRKSFYYHFKDKYDLINWIYDTEFIAIARERNYATGWELADDMCVYFYENRNFYRKIFSVEGQNCFSDYFREVIISILFQDLQNIEDKTAREFAVNFYADAFVCAVRHWITSKDCLPAEKFYTLIETCLIGVSNKVLENVSQE